MENGSRISMAIGSITLLCCGIASPALAAEEIVHRTSSWLTECSVDEKTRERNCSIWRSLASPELDSDAPSKLVFVINAVDDYGFVGSAPYAPASIAIDGNPAVAMYRAAGFTAVGRRRNYYHAADGRRFDALTFAREV